MTPLWKGSRCWLALTVGTMHRGGGRRSMQIPRRALGMTYAKVGGGFSAEKPAPGMYLYSILVRLLDGVAGQVVGVPDDGFAGDFRMFAQEFEGVGAGGGVVFLVGEFG